MTFEDVRYEALLQVSDQANGREVFWDGLGNRGAFYDYWNHSAVLLITDRENPQINYERFSHELAHALQDQQFNLTEYIAHPTMDGSYARRGIVEGGAKVVDREYTQRCERGEWECLEQPEDDRSSDGIPHIGLYGLQLVWYEHGMQFLWDDYQRNGTAALDYFFEHPPTSTEQVIDESSYPDDDPVVVSLNASQTNSWERVHPDRGFPYQERPDYARNGQAGIATMFVQTTTPEFKRTPYNAYNSSGVLNLTDIGNPDFPNSPTTPHINYSFGYADSWEGDRLHAYERGNQTAYVWRIRWETPADAEQFHEGYRQVLTHWGGTEVENGTWQIDERSPFTDAIRVYRDGDTVTIVNAPTVEDLSDVYDPEE